MSDPHLSESTQDIAELSKALSCSKRVDAWHLPVESYTLKSGLELDGPL